MKEIAKPILAACALLLCGELAAHTFKCTDAYGRITYSGKQCSDLGLKDAGEVKDQIQTAPAYRPPAKTEGARTSPPASAPAAEAPAPVPPPAQEPEAPQRRCFTVNTGKGTATRCNDTPPDADASPGNP
jgi:hypothetical protein